MYRAEVISNQSVQEDIIELLEEKIENFLYTLIPVVYGKGKNSKKLGNSTWPETNFIMVAYIEDEAVSVVKDVISKIKERFPDEGIKLFFVAAEAVS